MRALRCVVKIAPQKNYALQENYAISGSQQTLSCFVSGKSSHLSEVKAKTGPDIKEDNRQMFCSISRGTDCLLKKMNPLWESPTQGETQGEYCTYNLLVYQAQAVCFPARHGLIYITLRSAVRLPPSFAMRTAFTFSQTVKKH